MTRKKIKGKQKDRSNSKANNSVESKRVNNGKQKNKSNLKVNNCVESKRVNNGKTLKSYFHSIGVNNRNKIIVFLIFGCVLLFASLVFSRYQKYTFQILKGLEDKVINLGCNRETKYHSLLNIINQTEYSTYSRIKCHSNNITSNLLQLSLYPVLCATGAFELHDDSRFFGTVPDWFNYIRPRILAIINDIREIIIIFWQPFINYLYDINNAGSDILSISFSIHSKFFWITIDSCMYLFEICHYLISDYEQQNFRLENAKIVLHNDINEINDSFMFLKNSFKY